MSVAEREHAACLKATAGACTGSVMTSAGSAAEREHATCPNAAATAPLSVVPDTANDGGMHLQTMLAADTDAAVKVAVASQPQLAVRVPAELSHRDQPSEEVR